MLAARFVPTHAPASTHRRANVEDEGRMRAKEHIVQPRHGRQVVEVVGEPREHPRHAVIRLHLGRSDESEGKERASKHQGCVLPLARVNTYR